MKTKDFIKDLRKKNKMSIEEFASKLDVKVSLINNIESGKKEPNVKLINKLYTNFNMDNKDSDMLLKCINKKTKYNKILLLIILIISVLGIFFGSILVEKVKNNPISIYSFSGDSDNFKFTNGLVVFSNDNKYIEISGFKIKNNLDIKSMTINVAFNESIWAIKEYDSSEEESLAQWLKHLEISEYNKKGFILYNGDKSDSFSKYVTKFPYDFKVEINYCTATDCNVEILDIYSEKLNTNNKIKK